jgi:polar amino acid transport system permease protein
MGISLARRKIRITLLDVIVAFVLLTAGAYVAYRITIGLHYKWNWSAIPQYLFRYDQESNSWLPNVLAYGLLTTIKLSIWGTLLATIIGVLMGLCRISQSLFKRLIGRTYVELIRNLPPLVLIFISYFFLGEQIHRIMLGEYLFDFGVSLRTAFALLSLYVGLDYPRAL